MIQKASPKDDEIKRLTPEARARISQLITEGLSVGASTADIVALIVEEFPHVDVKRLTVAVEDSANRHLSHRVTELTVNGLIAKLPIERIVQSVLREFPRLDPNKVAALVQHSAGLARTHRRDPSSSHKPSSVSVVRPAPAPGENRESVPPNQTSLPETPAESSPPPVPTAPPVTAQVANSVAAFEPVFRMTTAPSEDATRKLVAHGAHASRRRVSMDAVFSEMEDENLALMGFDGIDPIMSVPRSSSEEQRLVQSAPPAAEIKNPAPARSLRARIQRAFATVKAFLRSLMD